jgi:hypothetical protein
VSAAGGRSSLLSIILELVVLVLRPTCEHQRLLDRRNDLVVVGVKKATT